VSIPINVGLSGASALASPAGGPFDVMSDIVFSGAMASYAPYDPWAASPTQTPTSSATGQGQAGANAPLLGGIAGGAGLLGASSSPVYLWIALAAAGGLGLWLMLRHKK
jgi:PAB1-binding protein PBP1